MFSKSAKPIPNSNVKNFINCFNANIAKNVDEIYLDTFHKWIVSSKNNILTNLDLYTNKKFIAGTIQGFDLFYLKFHNHRFRFFKGEFMYHKASLKNNFRWVWLDDENLKKGDAVIISIPFSDTGTMHKDILHILDTCEILDIPVLLDMAYYPIAKNIVINLDYTCIDSICFSLSKAYYYGEYLRCGIRYQKNNNDDNIDVFNSVGMTPRISMQIAIELMNQYSVDYNWETYGEIYKKVCKEFNLKETDCVIFGLGDDSFSDYNRGGNVNRVCISTLLNDICL